MFRAISDALNTSSVVLTLLIGIFAVYLWKRHRTLQSLPPGPRPLPLLGNLLDLAKGDQLEVFRKLRQKYGDLVTLHVGSFTIVVVSGYDTLRELFVKRGDVTSDRPDLFVFREITKGEGIASRSGPEWKMHRTFAIGALRDFGFGKKSLEGKIMEEVEVFLQVLGKENGNAVDLSRFIQISVSNIICSIVFGKRFEHDDPVFVGLLELMNENLSLAGPAGLLNLMPFLRFVPGDPVGSKKVLKNADKVMKYLYDLIAIHQQDYNEENMNDFIDVYIKEIKKREGQNSSFTESQMMNTIADLFIAGTETTATSLLWAVLFFLNYPDVEKKCREEIQKVVGEGRLPSLADKQKMPYTAAVLTEVLRRGDIAPLGVAHCPSQDLSFQGYVIPKGTILLTNLNSVHTDPTLFTEPDKFDPSRFIDENEELNGTDHVIPFFFGRRVCMGEALARNELFLFLTSMVQRFHFAPEDPTSPPPIKGRLGASFKPCSYKCKVEHI